MMYFCLQIDVCISGGGGGEVEGVHLLVVVYSIL